MNEGTRRPSRSWQAWALALMFFAPLLAASWLYYATGWRPGGTTNHGEILSPAVPLPQLALPTPQGSRTDADFLRGHWTLMYSGDGPCEAACRSALEHARQVRLALGRRMDRVQLVYLYPTAAPDGDWLEREHPELVAASSAGPEGERLRDTLPGAGFWLVDPLGNAMMRYPPDVTQEDLLEDLKKLLRVSRIG